MPRKSYKSSFTFISSTKEGANEKVLPSPQFVVDPIKLSRKLGEKERRGEEGKI